MSPRPPQDAESDLARRALVEGWYRDHADALHAYALRRVGEAEADDVVADAFVVAWRRADRVPADVLPWLYGVARRVVADRRRAVVRRDRLAARLAREPVVDTVLPAADGASTGLLAALARLGAADREALLLVAWEELDATRAAAALGVSRPTFHVRLHRARRRLAAELRRGTAGPGTVPVPDRRPVETR